MQGDAGYQQRRVEDLNVAIDGSRGVVADATPTRPGIRGWLAKLNRPVPDFVICL